jgi:hypothetical protein
MLLPPLLLIPPSLTRILDPIRYGIPPTRAVVVTISPTAGGGIAESSAAAAVVRPAGAVYVPLGAAVVDAGVWPAVIIVGVSRLVQHGSERI